MTKNTTSPLLKLIRRVAEDQRTRKLTDQELLGRFRTEHDETAFSGLVHRHGAMVLNACRRSLANADAAEDAADPRHEDDLGLLAGVVDRRVGLVGGELECDRHAGEHDGVLERDQGKGTWFVRHGACVPRGQWYRKGTAAT